MFLEKDKSSNFDFISIKEFLLASFLMLVATVYSFLAVPLFFKKSLPTHPLFIDSHYFGILVFFLSAILNFYVIYYFCCKAKHKTLQEGLFLYPKSIKITVFSILIGVIMPLVTLPIIFKFAPQKFYAMDLAKTQEGIIYLFTCALVAPLSEEVFFRGFIFPFVQSKSNSFWAVIITSIFFGLAHFMNIGNALVLFSLFTFYGLVLTLIRYYTNSLIPPMITHFLHNLTLMSCFLFAGRS